MRQRVAAIPENRVGPDFSASGVRPPMYAHPDCGHGLGYRPSPHAERKTLAAGR
ncbi:hypothetical protein [Streptomyces nojiriensis]|uniref:hypothetical protein n=1 Tax=Streptomyces nojiriensis TaxID=66374 RepID=UPI00368535BA